MTLSACGGSDKSDDTSADADQAAEDAISQYGDGGTEYSAYYGTDPDNLDYLFSSRATNSDHYTNFVEGLTQTDSYGNIIPDMAESWDVSDDGLTYTFHIREGVKWVTADGEEFDDVKAQDWVTALQHAADTQSETLYIVESSIAGLSDYVNGTTTDFSTVGVKATDDYTVEYTLAQPEPYFLSKTLYGILYPVNAEFLTSEGDQFGAGFEPDSILYNGPFLLSNFTSKSVIEYVPNDSYWDLDAVHLTDVKFIYNDGSDLDSGWRDLQSGTLTAAASVNPNSPGFADAQAAFPDGITTSQLTTVTYWGSFNLNRSSYNNTAKTTEEEKESTRKAVLNKQFRQAISAAFDRESYQAQTRGADYAAATLRNSLIPADFVPTEGETFNDLVTADMKDIDSDTWGDVDLAEGQDAYYDPDKAAELFATAKTALEADGVEFPIHLDYVQDESVTAFVNQAKSFKKSVEDALGSDNVVIDIVLLSEDDYNASTYYATTGAQSDYDLSFASGWGPDYQDPKTYLDIYNSRTGDVVQTLGLDPSEIVTGDDYTSADAVAALGLEDYDALLDTADAIKDDDQARYAAYAEAQAWLNDATLSMIYQAGGGTPRITHVVPFSGPFASSGITDMKLTGVRLQEQPVSVDQLDAAVKDWTAKREEG
ncbi:MAG: peptide ABC transporter substrate-binding protein [Microbacterium sp.]